jgi:hypothetical protein
MPEALRRAHETQACLRAALRRINGRFGLVPPDRCPDVNGPRWVEHDRAIEGALASGDFEACIEVIAAWEQFAFTELSPEVPS